MECCVLTSCLRHPTAPRFPSHLLARIGPEVRELMYRGLKKRTIGLSLLRKRFRSSGISNQPTSYWKIHGDSYGNSISWTASSGEVYGIAGTEMNVLSLQIFGAGSPSPSIYVPGVGMELQTMPQPPGALRRVRKAVRKMLGVSFPMS